MNLSYEEMDGIVTQAKGMGTYVYLFTGGEPLVRKKDIIRLCEAHPDCVFSGFTNGTLIDEAFAGEMLRVKNFVPAISIEGFEEATPTAAAAMAHTPPSYERWRYSSATNCPSASPAATPARMPRS